MNVFPLLPWQPWVKRKDEWYACSSFHDCSFTINIIFSFAQGKTLFTHTWDSFILSEINVFYDRNIMLHIYLPRITRYFSGATRLGLWKPIVRLGSRYCRCNIALFNFSESISIWRIILIIVIAVRLSQSQWDYHSEIVSHWDYHSCQGETIAVITRAQSRPIFSAKKL